LHRFLPVKGYHKSMEIMRITSTMSGFKGRVGSDPEIIEPVKVNNNPHPAAPAPAKDETKASLPNGRAKRAVRQEELERTLTEVIREDDDDDGLSMRLDGSSSGPDSVLLAAKDGGLLHKELVVTIAEE
jgi:hypothetical protein